jgi:hypothetical protein
MGADSSTPDLPPASEAGQTRFQSSQRYTCDDRASPARQCFRWQTSMNTVTHPNLGQMKTDQLAAADIDKVQGVFIM